MHRLFKGVLLDIDGTLVDSNEAHALAWEKSLHENGFRCSLDEICPYIGMGADHLLPKLVGVSAKDALGKKLTERKNAVFHTEFLPQLQPTCGAKLLVERLKALGLQVGVATSASDDEVSALLKVCGVDQMIPIRTSKTEAGASKPSPNVVEVALAKLGTYPGETLMIGDTPYDIQAALQCGIQTLAMRCGGWNDDELPGAIAIFDHPKDLIENLEFSPLAFSLTTSTRGAA